MLVFGVCVAIYNAMQTNTKNDWNIWNSFLVGVPAFAGLIGLAILTVVFGYASYANGWDEGYAAAKSDILAKVDEDAG